MLHKSKGSYKFQNKATYCIEHSLNPIILAYLKQLLKNKDSCMFGVPSYYMQKQAEIQGINLDDYWSNVDDIDMEAALSLRMKDLEELVWVFSQTSEDEPEMKDYGLDYEWPEDKPFKRIELQKDAFDNYNKACDEYQNRKEAAYRLFGEVYTTLDY